MAERAAGVAMDFPLDRAHPSSQGWWLAPSLLPFLHTLLPAETA